MRIIPANDCAGLSCPYGSPGGSAGTAWLWDVVLKVVPTADGGNNLARSPEANLCDVKLVRASPKVEQMDERPETLGKGMAPQAGLEPTTHLARREASNRAELH